jgi:tRNA (Thr-GGU) A37 N-methylase
MALLEESRRVRNTHGLGRRRSGLLLTAKVLAMHDVTMRPIGVIRSERKVVEDDGWDAVRSYIEVDGAEFTPEALTALDQFSHVEVVFYMDRVDAMRATRTCRRRTSGPRCR